MISKNWSDNRFINLLYRKSAFTPPVDALICSCDLNWTLVSSLFTTRYCTPTSSSRACVGGQYGLISCWSLSPPSFGLACWWKCHQHGAYLTCMFDTRSTGMPYASMTWVALDPHLYLQPTNSYNHIPTYNLMNV